MINKIYDILINNHIADAFQYYSSCRSSLELIDYNFEILKKLVEKHEFNINDSIVAQNTRKIEDSNKRWEYIKQHAKLINTVKIDDEYYPFSNEINSRSTLIIGLVQNYFETYSNWLLHSISPSNKSIDYKENFSLLKHIRQNNPEHLTFIEQNNPFTSDNIYFHYFRDLNNILKHDKYLEIELTYCTDGKSHYFLPKYVRTKGRKEFTHDNIPLIKSIKGIIDYCHTLLNNSVEYISDYYEKNKLLNLNRIHISQYKLFTPCFVDDKKLINDETYFLICTEPSIKNCYIEEISVYKDNSMTDIVGKLILDEKINYYTKTVNPKEDVFVEIVDREYMNFEMRYIPYKFIKS